MAHQNQQQLRKVLYWLRIECRLAGHIFTQIYAHGINTASDGMQKRPSPTSNVIMWESLTVTLISHVIRQVLQACAGAAGQVSGATVKTVIITFCNRHLAWSLSHCRHSDSYYQRLDRLTIIITFYTFSLSLTHSKTFKKTLGALWSFRHFCDFLKQIFKQSFSHFRHSDSSGHTHSKLTSYAGTIRQSPGKHSDM